MQHSNLISLNIKALFSKDKYVIPVYQRNYAWTEKEIVQLIQDVADFAKHKNELNYHIGSLVVFERPTRNGFVYETIDGQQRLTTLNILLCVIKRSKELSEVDLNSWLQPNLEFDSRQISTDTLEALHSETELHYQQYKKYNTAIQQAFADAEKALLRILKENNLSMQCFYNYLTEKVLILRVPVPPETDLNHYFEIMNNRGEQLEKHEVLKARFLEILKDEATSAYAFNLIWEACSNMERYVQYGFSIEQRNLIFSTQNWDEYLPADFDGLCNALVKSGSNETHTKDALSIVEIIKTEKVFKSSEQPDVRDSERFSSIITFSNFLLHVLRIQTGENITLDDKAVLNSFEHFLSTDNSGSKERVIEFAKKFGYTLLKCKWLYDRYILKREFLNNKDQWSLKRLKRGQGTNVSYVNTFARNEEEETSEQSGDNKNILMVLAMFHVSAPTQVYKHWMNAALKAVIENPKLSASEYLLQLEKMAKAFLFNRYLQKEQMDYYHMIYENGADTLSPVSDFGHFLNCGTAVENFIFNYLDYLLWKNEATTDSTFEFTFRSSVEHFYPQHPIAGNDKIGEGTLNHFGNLCLISSSKNSALSNYMPKAKRDHYSHVRHDSMKQKIMMSILDQKQNWAEDEIIEHGDEMIRLLKMQHPNYTNHG